MKRYRTIVADPPWPLSWSGGVNRLNGRGERWQGQKKGLGYPTLTVAEICALPVGTLAEDNAALFVWIPDEFLIDGAGALVCRAWGFEPGRVLLWWAKRGFGLGTFPRPQHEALIVAKRGRVDFAVRNAGSVQQWGLKGTLGRRHSVKPDAAIDLIESASPPPYLELFARRHRLGWDVWGNESANTAGFEAPA